MAHRKRNILMYVPSLLYGQAVRLRNYAFERQWLRSYSSTIPTICVGNLSVGGTGKTPHVELLIRILSPYYERIGVLTRGYGRRTRGALLASRQDSAYTIGDEPFQVKRKYPEVMMYVDANRSRALKVMEAMDERVRPQVIIMDDGFQHRYVTPTYSLLLTPYDTPYFRDDLLPYGRLREPAVEHLRADSIVVTNVPDHLSPMDFRVMIDNLSLLQHQDAYFSRVAYGQWTALFGTDVDLQPSLSEQRVLVVAGIGNPEYFLQQVERDHSHIVDERIYPDHYAYTSSDVQSIVEAMDESGAYLLTTEKDAMRLLSYEQEIPQELRRRIYYLPIEVELSPKSMDRLMQRLLNALHHPLIAPPHHP